MQNNPAMVVIFGVIAVILAITVLPAVLNALVDTLKALSTIPPGRSLLLRCWPAFSCGFLYRANIVASPSLPPTTTAADCAQLSL